MKNKNVKEFILLEFVFLIYSISPLLSKIAIINSQKNLKYLIIFYSLSLIVLFIYAIIWQQVLKKIPLSIAFSHKGTTIAWGMIWSMIVFKEKISVGMIIGSLIIITGIVIMMIGEKTNE